MKRCLIAVLAALTMLSVALLAPPRKEGKLLILDWAKKAKGETPPAAVLLEFGLTDKEPADWSGDVAVTGAKVVHREGYRFRKTDKLNENAFEASSHRAIKVPPRRPQVSKMEKIATVGVVLHLADIKPDAALTLAEEQGDAASQRHSEGRSRRQAENVERRGRRSPGHHRNAGRHRQDRGRLPRRLLRARRHPLAGLHQLHAQGRDPPRREEQTSRNSRRISRNFITRSSATSFSSSITARASGASRSR